MLNIIILKAVRQDADDKSPVLDRNPAEKGLINAPKCTSLVSSEKFFTLKKEYSIECHINEWIYFEKYHSP